MIFKMDQKKEEEEEECNRSGDIGNIGKNRGDFQTGKRRKGNCHRSEENLKFNATS